MELKDTKSRVAAPKKVSVRAKAPTTALHHCYLDLLITEQPVELSEIDSWTQSQIDAGKLELC